MRSVPHYGLLLAGVAGLPSSVVETARSITARITEKVMNKYKLLWVQNFLVAYVKCVLEPLVSLTMLVMWWLRLVAIFGISLHNNFQKFYSVNGFQNLFSRNSSKNKNTFWGKNIEKMFSNSQKSFSQNNERFCFEKSILQN